jgi:predicted nucleotidyltransferase
VLPLHHIRRKKGFKFCYNAVTQFKKITTMDRNKAIEVLKQHQDNLKQFGVKTLAIFGSVARNEAQEESDIDILIDFEGSLTFDRYMDVKFYIEDTLNVSVDLVTWKMLKPQIKSQVEQELIYVA